MLRDIVKFALEQKRMSVAKLSGLTDVHQDEIYNFLNGKSQMTTENIDKLLKVLRDK